jgi:hypothetical protein
MALPLSFVWPDRSATLLRINIDPVRLRPPIPTRPYNQSTDTGGAEYFRASVGTKSGTYE